MIQYLQHQILCSNISVYNHNVSSVKISQAPSRFLHHAAAFEDASGTRRSRSELARFGSFVTRNGWLITHFHNFHLHLYLLIIPLKFQPRNEIILFTGVSTHVATVAGSELSVETFTVNIQQK